MHCLGQSNSKMKCYFPYLRMRCMKKILTQCNSHNILWNKLNAPTMYHHCITNKIVETHLRQDLSYDRDLTPSFCLFLGTYTGYSDGVVFGESLEYGVSMFSV